MPNSLRNQISKLRYKGKITQEECDELIKKLDGHDAEIRAKMIEEIDSKIEEVLKEPNYQHDGEDWRCGLITAQEILAEY